MAQRAIATQGIDRVAQFALGLAAGGFEGVLEKFDAEQAVDEYVHAIGAPPTIVVPDDVLNQRRAERAQQEQAMQQMAMAQQGADVAKTASQAQTSEPSLLSEMAQ
jgi:hypothetical protein